MGHCNIQINAKYWLKTNLLEANANVWDSNENIFKMNRGKGKYKKHTSDVLEKCLDVDVNKILIY